MKSVRLSVYRGRHPDCRAVLRAGTPPLYTPRPPHPESGVKEDGLRPESAMLSVLVVGASPKSVAPSLRLNLSLRERCCPYRLAYFASTFTSLLNHLIALNHGNYSGPV